jgi:hypothetical protein
MLLTSSPGTTVTKDARIEGGFRDDLYSFSTQLLQNIKNFKSSMHGNRSFTSARDDRIQDKFHRYFFNIIVEKTCPQPSLSLSLSLLLLLRYKKHTPRDSLSRARKKKEQTKNSRARTPVQCSLSLAQHRLREKHSTQKPRHFCNHVSIRKYLKVKLS